MPFEFEELDIKGVFLIKPKVFEDDRGFFLETYKKDEFIKNGIKFDFIQENHSKSKKGVIRGLHFQKEPYVQAKLVRCIKGEIFDVAVDIRKGSTTYGKYVSALLSEDNKQMLFIPRGFAHGFQALSDEAEIIYKIDNIYAPDSESGIIYNDKSIEIRWPLKNPILSNKDMQLGSLNK